MWILGTPFNDLRDFDLPAGCVARDLELGALASDV
jgi:hypothetical protein